MDTKVHICIYIDVYTYIYIRIYIYTRSLYNTHQAHAYVFKEHVKCNARDGIFSRDAGSTIVDPPAEAGSGSRASAQEQDTIMPELCGLLCNSHT